MKNFLVVLFCGLSLLTAARADDLSLGGNAQVVSASPSSPLSSTAPSKIHLDLDDRADQKAPMLDVPTVNNFSAPAAADGATPGTGWVNSGASQAGALDAQPSGRAMSTLDTAVPGASGPNFGVPESWIYYGLGLLLVALVWACSGMISHPRTPTTLEVQEQQHARRNVRTRRVKMIALNVDHRVV